MGPLILACLVAGCLPIAPVTAAGAAPTSPEAPHSILVLYSNVRLLPANTEFDRGLRQPELPLEIDLLTQPGSIVPSIRISSLDET